VFDGDGDYTFLKKVLKTVSNGKITVNNGQLQSIKVNYGQ
jgi:hypothetical protein